MATHTAGRALRATGALAVVVAALAAVAVANGPKDVVPESAPVIVVRESVTVEKVAPPAVVTDADLIASVVAAPTDEAFVHAARAVVARTNLNGLEDADLIGLGKTFCEGITNGASPSDFVKSASLMVVPLSTYRSLLSLSEITYCPEHIGFRI